MLQSHKISLRQQL